MNLQAYIQKRNTDNKKENKILQILFSLNLCLFIIFTGIKITLVFKPLYYFDIEYLNIEEQSNFSKKEIIENYDYVINYLVSPKNQEFNLPSIPYSKYGQIHFKDVKRIFNYIDILLIPTGFISIVGLIIVFKYKKLASLKLTSYMLILISIIISAAFMLNFNTAFIMFHKLFFRNDYWQFDPKLDPIINILPEEFFYHSAFSIIIIIILNITFLRLLYKKFSSKK